MLHYVEVHKVDPEYHWLEVICEDAQNQEPTVTRLVVGDAREMTHTFIKKYRAKQGKQVSVPENQWGLLEEFFEEVCMAQVFLQRGTASSDVLDLLPTTVIHFKSPEKTTFRKSRAVRIKMFLNEAFALLQQRDFQAALQRLEWVHHLDPADELAFELKVVCLRSWKKMAECVPVFEAWIGAHPDRVEPRLGLSEMWLYLEQNQRAKDSFHAILEKAPNHCMALVGLAQAKLKMGEDPSRELRKAWMLDQDFTREMVENHFDFRGMNPRDLEDRTLSEIAKTYQIPLTRVLDRARKGVLPMHPPESDGLFRFSTKELDRYYEVLKILGLEISGATKTIEAVKQPEAYQPGLFDTPE